MLPRRKTRKRRKRPAVHRIHTPKEAFSDSPSRTICTERTVMNVQERSAVQLIRFTIVARKAS